MKFLVKLFSFTTAWRVGLCVLLSLLAGCESCETINCGPYQQYSFTLIGFNINEINTIEVRSFSKGSNFTEPESEWIITPDNASYVALDANNAFLISPTPGKSNFQIASSYDYEVFVPSTTTRRLISEITDVASQEEHCAFSFQRGNCNNTAISSCMLDGTLYQGGIPALSR